MWMFDPLYLLVMIPGALLAFWAQTKVKRAFDQWSRVGTARGLSGAETAAAILRTQGVSGVRIEPVDGFLSDHYDPTTRTLRLSPAVYSGRSVAAAAVAAHEVGHALQHAEAYPWLTMRSNLVPVLQVTSSLAMPMLMVGFLLLAVAPGLGQLAIQVGALLFGGMVLFQLVTLPVEFDASKRALAAIERGGLVTAREHQGAKEVLDAAALTYVAAAISAVLTFLYYLWRAGLLGGGRED